MKKILFLILLSSLSVCVAQHVAINGTGASPDAKAMLDIASTNSGLLIPRMTTVQRDMILSTGQQCSDFYVLEEDALLLQLLADASNRNRAAGVTALVTAKAIADIKKMMVDRMV